MLPAAVNSVGTLVGMWQIDKCGRRQAWLSSSWLHTFPVPNPLFEHIVLFLAHISIGHSAPFSHSPTTVPLLYPPPFRNSVHLYLPYDTFVYHSPLSCIQIGLVVSQFARLDAYNNSLKAEIEVAVQLYRPCLHQREVVLGPEEDVSTLCG